MSDAPATKKLTLMTTGVPLAEIVEEGTASMSADPVVYDLDNAGIIQRAVKFSFSRTFPRMGINLDGTGPLALPGDPVFSVALPEANAWCTPTLEFALETKRFSVQRIAIQADAEVEGTLVPELTYHPAGLEKEVEWNLHAPTG